MPHVLFLMKGGQKFLYPNEQNGIISMAQGTEFEIHCSGTENYVQGIPGNSTSFVAKCVNGKTISSPNANVIGIDKIKCSKPVNSVAKRIPAKKCNHNRNNIIEIGFEAGRNWLRLIEVCHDSNKFETLWVHFEMNPLNDAAQKVVRPRNSSERSTDFIQDDFYPGVNVDSVYSKEGSEKGLRRILGAQIGALLANNGGKNTITRGHLAAASDFVYSRQQMATFHFLNCAPQWQTFNNGNWNLIEKAIKAMINRINEPNTQIYTGTHGILTRANSELYLAESVSRGVIQPRIPIPKLFYKIVIMPVLRKGVVFVGVNDHQAQETQLNGEYRLCENVINRVRYVSAIRANLTQINNGFIYACEVDSFMAGLKAAKMDTLPPEIPTNLGLPA